ncbi:MAG: 4'-phosphopantetheinyl transferase superfamily protein [Rhodospirillaceae bacterium]
MIPAGTIEVWTIGLDGLSEDGGRAGPAPDAVPRAWIALLDPDETERCCRLRRLRDRLAFAAAHALLRLVLGKALNLPPAAPVLTRDRNGKPVLAAPTGTGLHFNLSHTDGMAAAALSSVGPVGVDVEAVDRPGDLDDALIAFALTPSEASALTGLSETARAEAFFAAWTAREAVAKADGRGLSLPFTSISLDRDGRGATITAPATVRRWRLWRHHPSARHRLALAGAETFGPGAEPALGALTITPRDGYALTLKRWSPWP